MVLGGVGWVPQHLLQVEGLGIGVGIFFFRIPLGHGTIPKSARPNQLFMFPYR